MGDPLEQTILDNVEEYGWHINAIPEDDEGPAFAYSIGMYRKLAHPEIIMIGQRIENMHGIINHIGDLIRAGQRFEDGGIYPGVLEGYDVCFRLVAREHYPDYFGYTRWFYNGDDFPVLQCIWPSRSGLFPWDSTVRAAFRGRQPLLFLAEDQPTADD